MTTKKITKEDIAYIDTLLQNLRKEEDFLINIGRTNGRRYREVVGQITKILDFVGLAELEDPED